MEHETTNEAKKFTFSSIFLIISITLILICFNLLTNSENASKVTNAASLDADLMNNPLTEKSNKMIKSEVGASAQNRYEQDSQYKGKSYYYFIFSLAPIYEINMKT